MVHVGADVRCVFGAGAGAGRTDLFPDAALSPRRHRQRAAHPAPEGQARQPVECIIGSAGMMRMALAQAVHHARHRTVFQKKLSDQPMMRMLLADMALEMEGVTALMMRLCRSLDHTASDKSEAARARLLTPAVKYWVCKSAPPFIYEAMECLGGNGYVEELPLARLFREAPVNAIWEGSGNVMCLDVVRAARRDPAAVDAL